MSVSHVSKNFFARTCFYCPLSIPTHLVGPSQAGTLLGIILKRFLKNFLTKVDPPWLPQSEADLASKSLHMHHLLQVFLPILPHTQEIQDLQLYSTSDHQFLSILDAQRWNIISTWDFVSKCQKMGTVCCQQLFYKPCGVFYTDTDTAILHLDNFNKAKLLRNHSDIWDNVWYLHSPPLSPTFPVISQISLWYQRNQYLTL